MHINFVDFKKAFDSIHRPSLWSITRLYGVPSRFTNIFKAVYKNSTCHIKTNGGTTPSFDILTGVRQGCILSPFLFLLAIDYVMKKANENPTFGIPWQEQRLTDLDFADDLALLADSNNTLQEMTNDLDRYGKMIGLRISSEKTKTMTIGPQHTTSITLEGQPIEDVSKFPYLGSTIANDRNAETDFLQRIGKASAVFLRLQKVWSLTTIDKAKKIQLYMSIVVPTAIYACETWKSSAYITISVTKQY